MRKRFKWSLYYSYADFTVALFNNTSIHFKVDLVLGEPVFQSASLPWDNVCYWYLSQHLAPVLAPGARVLPGVMTVYAVPVEYEHLWKIRADVGTCEGFNLSQFDNLIQVRCQKIYPLVLMVIGISINCCVSPYTCMCEIPL